MTDKEPTSRQRSAFSDAVEILNELHNEGIPYWKIIEAMEWSGHEMHIAGFYMSLASLRKMSKESSND